MANVDNYMEQGGDTWNVGGTLNVTGTLNVADTATITMGAGTVKVKKIVIDADTDDTETDTGWDIPATAVVLDVLLNVTTADTSETIDVGILSTEDDGDANGFLDGVSIGTTGLKRGQAALDVGGAFWETNTRGVLLSNFAAGTDADDRGLYQEHPHLSTDAVGKSVSYTTSAATCTWRGSILIVYLEF